MSSENLSKKVSKEAQQLYQAFREGECPDSPETLEALCHERPDLADELRFLDQAFRNVANLLTELGAQPQETPSPDSSPEDVKDLSHAIDPDMSGELFSKLIQDLKAPRDPENYQTRGTIAVGGMSRIFEVWDERLRRILAMKVFPVDCRSELGKAERRRVSRFLEEAQVAAQLKHPAILPVHDLGIDSRGRPYITMPLVEGRDFAEIIDRIHDRKSGWTLVRGLGVVQRMCEAMAYAHSRGVVHRDLKPANLMVGGFGETYVMDWGLAKVADPVSGESLDSVEGVKAEGNQELDTLRGLLADESTINPMMTIDGQIVGTPAYMAPEQAAGRIDEVGPHSDIYSAGAVLYQLLTGKRPYEHLGKTSSPTKILEEIKRAPPKAVASLNPTVPTELAAICEKAMARDRSSRYPTMRDMAMDLQAYLEQRVVTAYETGAWAELKKWGKRNRMLALALACSVLAVMGGLSGILWMQADKQAKVQEANTELERTVYFDQIAFAQQAYEQGNTARLKTLLSQCDPILRGWEWHFFNHLSDTSVHTFAGHTTVIADLAVSPDGRWFVSAGYDGHVKLWDLVTGGKLQTSFKHTMPLNSVDISPDGDRVIAGISMGNVCIWNTETGEMELALKARGDRIRAHFINQGSRILTVDNDREAGIWDSYSGKLITQLSLRDSPITRIALSPDGKRFASLNRSGQVCLWDLDSCRIEEEISKLAGKCFIAFSPDGRELATSSAEGAGVSLKIWNLETSEKTGQFTGEGVHPRAPVVFSPDNQWLAWGNNAIIKILDAANGEVYTVLRGHEDGVKALEFLPDGRLLSAGGRADRMVKLWDIPSSQSPVVLPQHKERIWSIRFTKDSKRMVTASSDGEVRIWDLETRKILTKIRCKHNYLFDADLSPNENELASVGRDGNLCIWNTQTGEMKQCIEYDLGRLWTVAFDPVGKGYVAGSPDKGFTLKTEALAEEKLINTKIRGVEYSPVGRYFVTAGEEGDITVWEKDTGEQVWRVKGAHSMQFGGGLYRVRYSPDGRTIASTGEAYADRFINLWDAGTGECLLNIEAHQRRPDDIDFSPDGKRVFSVARNEPPAVWDVQTGRLVCTLPCTPISFGVIRVSPNGRYVAAGGAGDKGQDGRLLLWEVPEYGR